MIGKSEIIAHIQRIAKINGTAPGRQKFEAETGIKRTEWYGVHWARWGDALQEAGFMSNSLQGALEKEDALQAYVSLIEKLGRIPSEGDIRLARRYDASFPSHSTLGKHIGPKRKRIAAALAHAIENQLDAGVVTTLTNALSALPPETAASKLDEIDDTKSLGFVYLMKLGKYYKIGKTNAPDRRQYEIGLHVAEGIEPMHSIATDDPSGIEAYWHNRFKEKRMNGEWFNLSASDVRAFRLRKKFM